MPSALQRARWSMLITLTLLSLAYTAVVVAQEGEKAADIPTIKEVMKEVHMGPEGGKSLRDKVLAGEASAEEKQQLLNMYITLAENKPPMGAPADWQKKTFAVVLGAAKVVVGREGADAELRKATTCAACHKDHKPPQQ